MSSLNLGSGSTIDFELDGTSDRIVISSAGGLTLNGGAVNLFDLGGADRLPLLGSDLLRTVVAGCDARLADHTQHRAHENFRSDRFLCRDRRKLGLDVEPDAIDVHDRLVATDRARAADADRCVGFEGGALVGLEIARGIDEHALECSICKIALSEILDYVTDEALQIHGGYGYSSEYPVERIYRDARLMTIGEGTSEIQRMVIARHVLAME